MSTNVFAKMTLSPLVRERRKCDLEDGGEYERGQTSVEKSGDKGGRAERELKERIVMKRARHDASKMKRSCAQEETRAGAYLDSPLFCGGSSEDRIP